MMKEVALQRGGKCLSGEFVTTRAKLRWRYATGHEWNATASSVLDGGWCTQCYYDSMRGTLAQMQTTAIRGRLHHSPSGGVPGAGYARISNARKRRGKRLKFDFEG
jgi:hypothetical protein